MMHGPCGLDRPRSPCMENHVCAKKFPRPFTESTSIDKSGYIIYRRRKNENANVLKDGILLDNASVIPYNIEILKKYAAHINVEWCNRTSAIKYLFKYITKGVDRATVLVEKGPDPPTSENGSDPQTSEKGKEKVKKARNEIKEYQDCRYLSACESMWRTFAYSIHKRQPSVMKLVVHLEGEHNITIKDTDNLGRVIQKPGIEKTMFTEWMVLCRTSAFARTLTYVQIPEFFTWNNSSKVWSERKRGTSIGRVVTVHPASGDRYYLRILINKVKGPRSYKELRTFNGVTYPDFKSTCCARGLLANDAEWHESMAELNTWGTPSQLREMFVTLLIYCHVANPKELWDKCWKTLSEDILYKKRKEFKHPQLEIDDAKLEQYTLLELEKALRNQEHTLTDFPGMPTPDPLLLKELGNTLWQQELQYNLAEEKSRHDTQYTLLNREQLDVYQAIIESTQEDYGKLFFVYGAGGTGKTFLYQTIISRLRSEKKIVLPVASSGIAALLLPGGRTAHSRFNIPIDLKATSTCHITPGTMLAELIEKAALIIWDEAPMTHRHAFEALDKSLRDILSLHDPKAKTLPFGGKTVLLGGDFRQILPVIPQGTRAEIVSASISHSYLWESCHKFTLQKNMRLSEDEKEFSNYVLRVGDGNPLPTEVNEFDEDEEDQLISIDRTLVEEVSSDPHKQILEATYGRTDQWKGTKQDYTERAILTPRNETVDEINEYMISEADGVSKEYLSSDSFGIIDTDSANNETLYPVEYLNSLSFPGLPAHKLTLKVGAPFMLLRNLNQKKGLCNGTRLIVTYLGERVIRGEIVTGSHIGHKVDLPRIILSESVTKHPFTLERRQFPIRLCYAMTINKSQGQSLKGVVLYLPKPVFTHGQLYVGLSRVTTKSGLKIIQGKDQKIGRVKNTVYKEIYNGLPGNQILFATQFTTSSINTHLISLSTPESISDDHPEQASRNLQQLSIP
ncbi:ATP-dependent DNA helicase PIF1-like [Brassica rapa]|uniref:ATP-dependent DNA helicase PIF1-like n=1 Tax=Brassica campestris TaxID=3711 RepID=UPI00142E0ABA|nr:ATP-dependent DNA helicase PIF1-like [Brassica rapa]